MEVKKINTDTIIEVEEGFRPESFDSFVGQEHIKRVLQTAIDSAKKRESNM
jgi:Holliday junction resolvasome RuvABC ATP-dependent DNA helicase subunit